MPEQRSPWRRAAASEKQDTEAGRDLHPLTDRDGGGDKRCDQSGKGVGEEWKHLIGWQARRAPATRPKHYFEYLAGSRSNFALQLFEQK